ncbi:helix-turn-helix domain-containing protein [Treponema primitia]|uniref:helix-turn-helix domain-containing protein n=1 Tax=Treponema primitia TaxID=88058 RepID=UPI00397F5ABA
MITVLSIKEAAPVLGVAEVTLRRMIRKGEVPHHRIGSLYKFTESDIEEFFNANHVSARKHRYEGAV